MIDQIADVWLAREQVPGNGHGLARHGRTAAKVVLRSSGGVDHDRRRFGMDGYINPGKDHLHRLLDSLG
jgi:hypothetical protein